MKWCGFLSSFSSHCSHSRSIKSGVKVYVLIIKEIKKCLQRIIQYVIEFLKFQCSFHTLIIITLFSNHRSITCFFSLSIYMYKYICVQKTFPFEYICSFPFWSGFVCVYHQNWLLLPSFYIHFALSPGW